VLRRTVPDLRLGANCGDFGHLIQWNAILLTLPVALAGGPCRWPLPVALAGGPCRWPLPVALAGQRILLVSFRNGDGTHMGSSP
jgi:hypothetical protein